MSQVCLNPTDEAVVSLVKSSKEVFTNFTDDQIRAIAALYFQDNGKLPDTEQLITYYSSLEEQTAEESFDYTEVTEKEDVLDLLQSLFFIGLNRASKGKPLTKELIVKGQKAILDSLPKYLESEGLTDILENFEQYKELLIKSRLKNVDIEIDTDTEASEYQASKDNNWDRDSTTDLGYERSSDEVIYLFASLVSNQTIRGIPKPLNFSETWNRVQKLLAGTSDLPTQISILRRSNLPYKNQILDKLGYGNYQELSEENYNKVRTSFLESFAKSNVNFSKSVPGKRSYDSAESALKQTIKAEWKSNFLGSEYAKIINGKRVFNPERFEEIDELTGEEFLNALGIYVTEWDKSLNPIANNIKKYFYNTVVKKENNQSWLDEGKQVSSALNDLLEYEVSFRKEQKPLGARNSDGEYQHGVMLHSFLSKTIGKLKFGILKAKNDFERLFAEGKAELNIDQGMTVKGRKSKSFNRLTKGDLYVATISDMFSSQPIIHIPRTADKKSERGIKIFYNKTIAKAMDMKEYLNQFMAYTEISDKLYSRFYKQYKDDFIKKSLDSVGWTAKKTAPPLNFWTELLEYPGLERISLEDFKTRIDSYIQKELEKLYTELETYKVIEERNGKLVTAFSNAFIPVDKYDSLSKEDQKIAIQNLLKNYIFNSLLYGTEVTQFTMSSLTVVEPEEFFKRTAGPIAEGRQTRVDLSMINMLEKQRPDYMSAFPPPSSLRVIISSEEKLPSSKAEEYNKAIDQPGAYDEINVNDAQGKMLFESYREYKIMLNEWTNEQEEGYKLLLNNKLDNERYETLYPPIKPVGFSLIDIQGVKVPVYLKTAIYPIHKNWVKGTLNEKAYDAMISKGIAISLPQSGIKLAYPKNLKAEFENNEFVINDAAIFDFPVEDFKSQVDISLKDTWDQLMGTQQQKLIASNLYDNGQIVNPEFEKWKQERIDTLQEISDIELKKLSDRAGIVIKDNLPIIENYSKLKSMLKDELLNRNLPLNIIDSINQIIDQDGNLLATIDGLPSRQKLMNILNAIVNNRLIKLYTNGSSLVQVAQTGWELAKIKNPTKKNILAIESSIDFINDEAKLNYYNNNGLQFLQLGEKTGAAEILLPAKYKKYVKADGTLDERALINIGYRIPTQGLNSILHLKVIGFLPIGMDQMVIMPREITTQGGSDFDVDKLNIFIPNTFEGKYIDDSLSPEDAERFKLERLQNKLIEQSLQVLEHQQSVKSLLTPNSSKDLENLAETVSKKTKIKRSQMFTPTNLISITEQMYSSKALVGVFASQSTHHVLSQQVGLHFNSARNFYFNHNKINVDGKMVSSLSGVMNVLGQLITDRIGNQYVTGSVDAAKNPFLFELGCTLDTGSIFALFERLGGDVNILVQIMQQPIVKDYLLAKRVNKQLSNKYEKNKSNVIADVLKKYKLNRSNSEYLVEYYGTKKEKESLLNGLRTQRENFGDWETKMSDGKIISRDKMTAIAALDDFLYLEKAAEVVSGSIATTKFDTSGPGKDIIQSTLLKSNYDIFVRTMQNKEGFTLGTVETLPVSEKAEVKPGVSELFESNPELANAVYEALGFNQLITPNDRIVFGHPTIGKSFLKKQGEDKFISLDDDYATEINNKVKEIANKYNVTTYQVKDGGTQKWNNEYNQMMQEMFNVAKQRAISENKTLFTSNTNLLRSNAESFDKVINLTDKEFEKRIQERGAKYDIKEWKSQINEAISKLPINKVINTDKYLSDLFITSQQKQQAQQQYSQYIDTIFPDSKVKNIVYHGSKKAKEIKNSRFLTKKDINYLKQDTQTDNGIYFSANEIEAATYANISTQEEYQNNKDKVLKVLLNINSPKEFSPYYTDIDALEDAIDKKLTKEEKKEYIDSGEGIEFAGAINDKYLNKLKKEGYDAVIESGREFVVFEPEQIHILGSKQDIEGFKKFVGKPITVIKAEGKFVEAPYTNLIDKTLLKVFKSKSSEFIIDLYKDLVLLTKNKNIESLIISMNDPLQSLVSGPLDEEIATVIYGSVINYIIQRNVGFNPENFFGNNTTARKVQNIQLDPDHPLHNNYLFKDFFNPEIGNSEDVPDIISIKNKSIDPKEADFINQAFAEVRELDNDLYNELIHINFFQTGVVQSPVSYYSLIPNKDVLSIVNKALAKHGETILSMHNLTESIFKNVGNELNNIQFVNHKEGDPEFGDLITLPLDRTRGKDYIIYSQKVKNQIKQGIFQKLSDEEYVLLNPSNFKNIFQNHTDSETPIKSEEQVEERSDTVEDETVILTQPQAAVSTGFQGYKGGFNDKGKGTPEGDGKDKAMREVANGFIGEIVKNNTSSQTSRNFIIDKSNKADKSQNAPTSAINIPLQGISGANIIMLARNSERKGAALTEETKYWIRNANLEGAEFVVGDMPGVDSQFIDYLQEIGAKFTVYHTGNTPRINISKPTTPTKVTENAWNNLSPETQRKLTAKKITEEEFNKLNSEEQDNIIKCHG